MTFDPKLRRRTAQRALSARSRYAFDTDYAAKTDVQISKRNGVHRLPSSTLPSPILIVFAPPRILTIVRECSEATGKGRTLRASSRSEPRSPSCHPRPELLSITSEVKADLAVMGF